MSLSSSVNNSINSRIQKFVNTIEYSEFFSTSMTFDPSHLKIKVQGVGPLKFPIKPVQAKKLIQQAHQAPFGYREETLTDLSVRNVWEIKNRKIQIDQTSWDLVLQPS